MLSIILPSYKGSSILRNQLPDFIKYLKEKNIENEIIIVDDGSNDNGLTEKVALDFNCRYLENKKNKGKGSAVKKGMLNAKGEYRIFTDVDIPFEYDSIEKFLYYLDFKEFDVVLGDRTLKDSTYFAEIPKSRKIGSNIYSFIVGRFVTGGLFDTQCGMKGFRAKSAEDIFSVSRINGFAADVEFLYISLKRNYDMKRLPVKFRCNEDSSVSMLKHGTGMVIDLFRIKWNQFFGKYRNTI